MNDTIEQEIVACGANVAPRITPADIEANITNEYYFTAQEAVTRGAVNEIGFKRENGKFIPIFKDKEQQALSLLTFCVLILKNGFTVTGESACASPENFDAVIGTRVARQNAVNKIWPLMGYALKESLQ